MGKRRSAAVASVTGNAYKVNFRATATSHDPSVDQAILVEVLEALLTNARTGQLCGLIWISDDAWAARSCVGATGSYRTQRARPSLALAKAAEQMTPEPLRLVDGARGNCWR